MDNAAHHQRRRRYAKGRWMKLRDRGLLLQYMEAGDFSQARLARYAGVSRQFINQLIHGDRLTCTPAVGTRIEEALRVLPHTLFLESNSHGVQQKLVRRKTTKRAA